MNEFPEPLLETERLVLEPLTEAHAPLLFHGFEDPTLYTYIPGDPPANVEALVVRYRHLSKGRSADGTSLWFNWAMRLQDSVTYIGTLQASLYADDRAVIAYMVFSPFRRHGFAKEGCWRMIRFLRDERQAKKIVAEIDTRNQPSIALVRSLGMRLTGKHKNADFFKGSASDEYEFVLAI